MELPLSVGEYYRIELAPFSQRSFRRFLLEIVPLLEHLPSGQQVLEIGISASPAEHSPHLVEISWQDLAGEVQRERLPEIELPLIRYLEEFLAVADVIRQYVQVVAELGMTIELARLPAQKGLMLVPAVGADEFEGFQYVLQADRHGDPRR